MEQWCISTAWSADRVTALATVGLLVAAVWTGIVALRAYKSSLADKRTERTLDQFNAWYQKQGDSPSPETCYAILNDEYGRRLGELKAMDVTDPEYRRARSAFFTLHNYFWDAIFLSNRNLIDLGAYLSHQQVIIRSCEALLAAYYTLFEAQEALLITERPLTALKAVLDQNSAQNDEDTSTAD